MIVALVVAGVLLLGWLLWFVRTPDDLPTEGRTATAAGVVGTPIYVGMFSPDPDFDRTLHLSKVTADHEPDLEITPLLCRAGTLGVTTEPEQFCSELLAIDGATLTAGDSIVLRVEAGQPVSATVGRIVVDFRDGMSWGAKPAGIDGAKVRFVAREDS